MLLVVSASEAQVRFVFQCWTPVQFSIWLFPLICQCACSQWQYFSSVQPFVSFFPGFSISISVDLVRILPVTFSTHLQNKLKTSQSRKKKTVLRRVKKREKNWINISNWIEKHKFQKRGKKRILTLSTGLGNSKKMRKTLQSNQNQ